MNIEDEMVKTFFRFVHDIDMDNCVYIRQNSLIDIDGKPVDLEEFAEKHSQLVTVEYMDDKKLVEKEQEKFHKQVGMEFSLKYFVFQRAWHVMKLGNEPIGYNIASIVHNPFPQAMKSDDLINDFYKNLEKMYRIVQNTNPRVHFMSPSEEYKRLDVYFSKPFYERSVVHRS